MNQSDHYFRANKSNWEQKTRINIKSAFYNVEDFKKGESSLRSIEREGVGDVSGKRLLHLQCHFGMDTLSWARLGAKVVGVDFSEKAIDYAVALSQELQIPAKFICSNLYDLKKRLRGKFDIVFVSYGCLGWLPDLTRWADIVSHYLTPGGTLFLVDFHPVYWMLDGTDKIVFPYESGETPIVIPPHKGTYADPDAKIRGNEYWWNHGMSKIVTSLISKGLKLESLQEYDYSPYDAGNMVRRKDGNWTSKRLAGKIPYLFSIRAVKQG